MFFSEKTSQTLACIFTKKEPGTGFSFESNDITLNYYSVELLWASASVKVDKYLCWDTSTSSQVSNYDRVVLKNYFDRQFRWPQEGLISGDLLWSLEFAIQVNVDHNVW